MLSPNAPCFVPVKNNATNMVATPKPKSVPKLSSVPKLPPMPKLSVTAPVFVPSAKIYPSDIAPAKKEPKKKLSSKKLDHELDIIDHGLELNYNECSSIPPSSKNIQRLKSIINKLSKN